MSLLPLRRMPSAAELLVSTASRESPVRPEPAVSDMPEVPAYRLICLEAETSALTVMAPLVAHTRPELAVASNWEAEDVNRMAPAGELLVFSGPEIRSTRPVTPEGVASAPLTVTLVAS